MTAYTPAELLVALGRARSEAMRLRTTVHVVAKRGWRSLFIRGPLMTRADTTGETVVIRDVHPIRSSDDMINAATEALGYDPVKERIVVDMLRTISKTAEGEPLEPEQIATILWKLAEELAERDFQERRSAGYTRRVT